MTAGARYYVTLLARRQTVLAPVLLHLALVAIVYATDAGPPLAAAAIPAAALVPVGAWLMRLVASTEGLAFADVTLVALGSHWRRHNSRGIAALAVCAALSVVACVWARVANPHPYPRAVVVQILAMSLGAAIAGIGLGSLLAPPLRATAGIATLVVTGIVVLSLVAGWFPPLGPLLHTFITVRPPLSGRAAIAIAEAAGFGLVLFGAAHVLGRRAG